MSFREIRFPDDISYGSSGGPGFMTSIVEMDSGSEVRVPRWAQPRWQYNVAYGVKSQTQLSTLINFYMNVLGATYGFRYKDWADYTSASDGISALAFTDQTIGTGDGSKTTFQLVKKYSYGAYSYTRTIVKPVAGAGKVRVAADGVEMTSGWSIDTTTGVITFSSAPGVGVVITAGFEFDVPVRFGADVDKAISSSIDDYSNRSVTSITLTEVREFAPVDDEYDFGGGAEIIMSSNVSISFGTSRVQNYKPQSGGLTATLPATGSSIPGGAAHIYILNGHASNSFTLKSPGGSTMATIAAGTMVVAFVTVDGSGNKYWCTR